MTDQPEWPEWLNPKSASAYLDVSINTLADWRFRGVGPKYRRISERWVRYNKSVLDEFMEGRQ